MILILISLSYFVDENKIRKLSLTFFGNFNFTYEDIKLEFVISKKLFYCFYTNRR